MCVGKRPNVAPTVASRVLQATRPVQLRVTNTASLQRKRYRSGNNLPKWQFCQRNTLLEQTLTTPYSYAWTKTLRWKLLLWTPRQTDDKGNRLLFCSNSKSMLVAIPKRGTGEAFTLFNADTNSGHVQFDRCLMQIARTVLSLGLNLNGVGPIQNRLS